MFTYSGSDIVLLPSTLYRVVLTGATPIEDGAYGWSAAETTFDEDPGWQMILGTYKSTDGESWLSQNRSKTFQFSITATPVPELSSLVLLGLGGLLITARRRLSGKSSG